jgi:hypothetical protein
MMMLGGEGYRERGPLFAALEAYFLSRGVTSERKRTELRYRWLRQKGERWPP